MSLNLEHVLEDGNFQLRKDKEGGMAKFTIKSSEGFAQQKGIGRVSLWVIAIPSIALYNLGERVEYNLISTELSFKNVN